METYFKSVKSLRTEDKRGRKSSERLAPNRRTPQSLVEENSGDNVGLLDTVLRVEYGGDERHVTHWRPKSPYSLGSEEEEYIQALQVELAVPQAAMRDAEGGWSLQPITLKEHRLRFLNDLVPGYPLEGVLFHDPQHSCEGQVKLQLNFPKAIDYLRSFYETSIHLLEVVQDETHATTRLLVGSRLDPRMPHLPCYSPRERGGPWFRHINGDHGFLPTVRSYRSSRRLPHRIEFFFSVSSEQRSYLGELCSEM